MSKLLIVGDEEWQRDAIIEEATRAGYATHDIMTASEAAGATVLLSTQRFDLAVVDIHLGSMLEEAGVDLVRTLRAAQPRCKIIALTTKMRNDSGVRALANGADDFIGCWSNIDYRDLLFEKLSIYKALVEFQEFPKAIVVR